MTESDNRLFNVLQELDDNLLRIDSDITIDTSVSRASHTLHWLNQNIEKSALFDFIDEFGNNLEYQETIKFLLNEPLFLDQ